MLDSLVKELVEGQLLQKERTKFEASLHLRPGTGALLHLGEGVEQAPDRPGGELHVRRLCLCFEDLVRPLGGHDVGPWHLQPLIRGLEAVTSANGRVASMASSHSCESARTQASLVRVQTWPSQQARFEDRGWPQRVHAADAYVSTGCAAHSPRPSDSCLSRPLPL